MNVECGILSLVTICMLIMFAPQGDVALHSIEIGVAVDSETIRVTVDPAFVVWVDALPSGNKGISLAGVMVVDNEYRDTVDGENLLAHEFTHVKQQRALGLWFIPAGFGLNLEGEPYYSLYSTYEERFKVLAKGNKEMWLPPQGWANQWAFIAIALKPEKER